MAEQRLAAPWRKLFGHALARTQALAGRDDNGSKWGEGGGTGHSAQRLGTGRVQRNPLSAAQILGRSEEHTSELQSLMRISYAVICLKKKKVINTHLICRILLDKKKTDKVS